MSQADSKPERTAPPPTNELSEPTNSVNPPKQSPSQRTTPSEPSDLLDPDRLGAGGKRYAGTGLGTTSSALGWPAPYRRSSTCLAVSNCGGSHRVPSDARGAVEPECSRMALAAWRPASLAPSMVAK